ncbi:MAG: PKD domain-containing protein [Chitinophagaceae bacterium]|nr:PKD domain-containing protein [Chitinophagaceae bacterium]
MHFRCFLLCLLAWKGLSAATVTVTAGVGGNFFSPAFFTINPGDTVQWVWKDGHHNTSSYSVPAGAANWYSNLNSTDTQYLYVPLLSGLYQYTCTHHSAMDGSFFVSGCTYPDKPIISGSWAGSPCDGMAAIVLRTPAQAGASYQWLRSGGLLMPGATTDSLRTLAPSAYRVLVNRCGVDSLSAPFTVTSYPLPLPSFSFTASGLYYTFTNTTPGTDAYLFRWDFGDGSTEFTGIHATHLFSASSAYRVRLLISDSAGNCPDSTAQTIHTELDIQPYTRGMMTIAPNPATTAVHISCTLPCSVQLCDLRGTLLRHAAPAGSQHQLDLAGIPPGTYLLLLRDAQGNSRSERIIVY